MFLLPYLPLKCRKCKEKTIYQVSIKLEHHYSTKIKKYKLGKPASKKKVTFLFVRGLCKKCKKWQENTIANKSPVSRIPGGATAIHAFDKSNVNRYTKIIDRFKVLINCLENTFRNKGIEVIESTDKMPRIYRLNQQVNVVKTVDKTFIVRIDLVNWKLFVRFYRRNSGRSKWRRMNALLADDGTDNFSNLVCLHALMLYFEGE
jgi:hypothetical protein